MTEAEWLACNDPTPMVEFLRKSDRPSNRKLRLFALACCRHNWRFFVDPRSRAAIEASEKYADGTITNKELNTIERKAASAREKAVRTGEEELYNAAEAARQLASQFVDEMEAAYYALGASLASEADIAAGSSLLRDIFGNPFRPVSVDPAWLQWKDSTVPKLAQAIYNDRRFQDLPIVADALEKAGCTNQDILQHYRQSGEHVRGCWVVDVILGKK